MFGLPKKEDLDRAERTATELVQALCTHGPKLLDVFSKAEVAQLSDRIDSLASEVRELVRLLRDFKEAELWQKVSDFIAEAKNLRNSTFADQIRLIAGEHRLLRYAIMLAVPQVADQMNTHEQRMRQEAIEELKRIERDHAMAGATGKTPSAL